MIKFKKDWPLKNIKSKKLYPKLSGDRVCLSVPQLKDYHAWEAVRNSNKQFLEPYEPQWGEDALSKEYFKRRLEKQSKEMEGGRGAFFLIHHIDSNKIIGGININNIQYGAAYFASLGYWLDESCLSKGYMNEAARLAIDYAFKVLKLRRLNAACLPDNERSVSLLLKLGFEEEGFAKNYLQINGKWQDHRLFGLVNQE